MAHQHQHQHHQHQHQFHHGTKSSTKIFPPYVLKDCKDHFGYMINYHIGQKLDYTKANRVLLEELGESMIADKKLANSNIPSGYTYLGQFIDHNIDRDATSSLDFLQDARKIRNFRSPRLDLDSVYGLGPALQPFLYQKENPIKLLIGKNASTTSTTEEYDLPRNNDGTAIIGDPRNDENILVAQTHLAFLKFHNAVVDLIRKDKPNLSNDKIFAEAKKTVTLHYQWVVVNDFLKTIANPSIVNQVFESGNQFFIHRKGFPRKMYIPVEFAVGAYRFGHTMVRDKYQLNGFSDKETGFGKLFKLTGSPLPKENIIDWKRFYSFQSKFKGNLARKIDTNLADPLFDLPEGGMGLPSIMKFLAKRNLVRSMALGVPTGQAVATFFGRTVIPVKVIKENANPKALKTLSKNNNFLANNTPLWYYILKEAELREGNQLGEIGSIILAEVFHRMLRLDKNSIIRKPSWRPHLGEKHHVFTMVDLLKVARVV